MKNYKKHLSCALIVLLCSSIFSLWFYKIGRDDEYINVLSWAVADKKIVVDPGHGGIFPGKVGYGDIIEKDINLEIALKLAQLLNEGGAMVLLTRESDQDLVGDTQGSLLLKQRADLKQRVDLAKIENADIFLSIHCNGIASEKWRGAQSFFDPDNLESEQMAKSIQSELIRQLKNTKRQALKREDTYLFRNLDIPTVIIECGFLSNPQEARLLAEEDYQHCLAFAIYAGIVKFYTENVVDVQS